MNGGSRKLAIETSVRRTRRAGARGEERSCPPAEKTCAQASDAAERKA